MPLLALSFYALLTVGSRKLPTGVPERSDSSSVAKRRVVSALRGACGPACTACTGQWQALSATRDSQHASRSSALDRYLDPQLPARAIAQFLTALPRRALVLSLSANCTQCDRDTYSSHGSQLQVHSSCRVNDCRASRREVRWTRCRAAAPCHLCYETRRPSRPSGRWPGRPSPLVC